MFENIKFEENRNPKVSDIEARWCLEVPGVAYYGKFHISECDVYYYTDMAYILENKIITFEYTFDTVCENEVRIFSGYCKKDFVMKKLKTEENIQKFYPIDMMEETPSKLEISQIISNHINNFNLF